MPLTKEQIKDILNRYRNGSQDEQSAIADALSALLQAKSPQTGGSMPLPPEIKIDIDPDLQQPKQTGQQDPSEENPSIDIDDPEDLLDQESGSEQGSQDPDSESQKSKDGEVADEPSKQDANSSADSEDDGMVHGDASKDLDDAEKKRADADKAARGKEMSRTISQLNDAAKKLEKDLSASSSSDENKTDNSDESHSDETEAKKNLLDRIKQKIDELNQKKDDLVNEEKTDSKRFYETLEDALELCDQVTPENKSIRSVKDRKDVFAKKADDLAKKMNDEERDSRMYRDAIQNERAKERIKAAVNFPGMQRFELDFHQMIEDQLKKGEVDDWSYDHINRQFEQETTIMPGHYMREKEEIEKPMIAVFMDCSSSFSKSDVDNSIRALGSLSKWEDDGEIDVDLYYFADHVHDSFNRARNEGCNGASPEIFRLIQNRHYNNVVIMTDNNEDGVINSWPGTLWVHGVVCYLWRGTDYGEYGTVINKKLKGELGTWEYNVSKK